MEAGRLLTLAFVIAALWWTGAALRRRTSDGVATLAVRMFALSATTWTVTGVWLDFKDLGSDPFDLRPLYRWSLRLGLVALATLVVLWLGRALGALASHNDREASGMEERPSA